jgi:hypothetical protein
LEASAQRPEPGNKADHGEGGWDQIGIAEDAKAEMLYLRKDDGGILAEMRGRFGSYIRLPGLLS